MTARALPFHAPLPPRDRGFTLAEALVSLFVFGLIATMIGAVLSLQARADASLSARSETDDAVVVVQTMLRSRIEAARNLIDAKGVHDTVSLSGTAHGLDFIAPAPRSEGPHALQRYRLRRSSDGHVTLWHVSTLGNVVDAPEAVDGWTGVPLLDHAARLDLAYFGPDRFTGRDAWQTEWLDRHVMPRLIRITLDFDAGDARVWPQFMVAPGSRLASPCREGTQSLDCGDRP